MWWLKSSNCTIITSFVDVPFSFSLPSAAHDETSCIRVRAKYVPNWNLELWTNSGTLALGRLCDQHAFEACTGRHLTDGVTKPKKRLVDGGIRIARDLTHVLLQWMLFVVLIVLYVMCSNRSNACVSDWLAYRPDCCVKTPLLLATVGLQNCKN